MAKQAVAAKEAAKEAASRAAEGLIHGLYHDTGRWLQTAGAAVAAGAVAVGALVAVQFALRADERPELSAAALEVEPTLLSSNRIESPQSGLVRPTQRR